MTTMTRFLLPAVLAAASFSALSAQEQPIEPSVITFGSGVVRVDPDVAHVRLGVSSRSPTAREAQAMTNAAIDKLYTEIDRLRIDRKDVQTSRLTLNAYYEGGMSGQPRRLAGYEASNVVTVRLTDFAKIGPVIDAGVASGVNTMEGVSFGLLDDTDARMRALREAAREAQQKAEAMASALGIRLGDIILVTESGSYAPPMPLMERGMAMDMKSAGATVSPGQLEVTANVTVRFAIRR